MEIGELVVDIPDTKLEVEGEVIPPALLLDGDKGLRLDIKSNDLVSDLAPETSEAIISESKKDHKMKVQALISHRINAIPIDYKVDQ